MYTHPHLIWMVAVERRAELRRQAAAAHAARAARLRARRPDRPPPPAHARRRLRLVP